MPRIQRIGKRSRKEWGSGHRMQLECGCDFFGDAWGPPRRRSQEELATWPSPEIEAEMAQAWAFFRDEIMAEYGDTLRRPWYWWRCEAPEPRTPGMAEAEQLEEMGVLTEAALKAASESEIVCRGVVNDAHEPAFRRSWGWWRFRSPERRNKAIPEAVQLVAIHRAGHDVLTGREKHLAEHGEDVPVYKTCRPPRLTPEEVEALKLSNEFLAGEFK